jgi:hypothetical protein
LKTLDALAPDARLKVYAEAVRRAESELKAARAEIEANRVTFRQLTIEEVKAEENLERSQRSGMPATVTAPLQSRVADVRSRREMAQGLLVSADKRETEALELLRVERGEFGVARVMTRTIEICIEKRRAQLGATVAAKPADTVPPVSPLAGSFTLAGTYSGACNGTIFDKPQSIPINGTFSANVTKGGAVSGRYTDPSGSGQLSGTLAEDGKLAVGSADREFAIRWVGTITTTAGGRSGSGTWRAGTKDVKCGGSWTSTKGPPA